MIIPGWYIDISLFSKAFRLALEPNQSPIQRALGALLQIVKWMRHTADLSPEFRNVWSYISTAICLHGMVNNWAEGLCECGNQTQQYFEVRNTVLESHRNSGW
jgi:hypothetical protein